MTEELFEDASDIPDSDDSEVVSNNTNEADLLYFERVSNHYLCLVKATPTQDLSARHQMQFPVIADSGANYHMFKEAEFFDSLTPARRSVILGDGKTRLPIQGVGTVKHFIGEHLVQIENDRYIPDLSESIYSLFLHIQQPQHGLESSFEGGLFLKFPGFSTKAIIGRDDIYLDFTPATMSKELCGVAPVLLNPEFSSSSNFCRKLSDFQENLEQDSENIDYLLSQLKQYYTTIQTKQWLNLDVPAGFRKTSQHQQNVEYCKQLTHIPSSQELDIQSSSSLLSTQDIAPSESITLASISDEHLLSNTTLSSYTVCPPIVRSADKVSSSLPRTITVSEDYLRASVEFRKVDSIKQHFQHLYQDTLKVDNLPADAILDSGDYATLRKKNRSTTNVSRPSHFGAVMHMDIVFGPEVAIGNTHYALLFSDQYSRMNYIYPLQNLTSEIPKQMEAFFAHISRLPDRLISDFDLKLIGGKAREYLNSLLIHVNAAPAYRQDKNGLVERHWQTMVSMARNWLASAELPASFWYFAVRRAAEICNYFPYKLEDGIITTPFELAHQSKPDLRVLFKLFSLAAVRHKCVGDNSLSKFDSQSIPMIAVGRCPNSDGLQFFNPTTGAIVSSIDYKFLYHTTSGARFGYTYQPGTFIYRLDESTTIYQPKFPLDSTVLIRTHSPPHVAKIIGLPSYDRPDIYTVLFADGSISDYSDQSNILETSCIHETLKQVSLLPSWVQHEANATLFLSNMT
jgi:hypothetical protein